MKEYTKLQEKDEIARQEFSIGYVYGVGGLLVVTGALEYIGGFMPVFAKLGVGLTLIVFMAIYERYLK